MHPLRAWKFYILFLLGGIFFAFIGAGAYDNSASNNIFAYIMFGVAALSLITGFVFNSLVKCPVCDRHLWYRRLPQPYCGHCGNKIPGM